jgi:hypothetical protein
LVVKCLDIALALPGSDFVDESLFVGNPAVEALGGKDAKLGFRQIELTTVLGCVAPLESLDQPPGFGWREFARTDKCLQLLALLRTQPHHILLYRDVSAARIAGPSESSIPFKLVEGSD